MGNDNSFRPKPAHSGNLIADVLIDTAINAIPITNAVHSAYRNRDHHQTQDYRTQTQSTRLTPPIKGPSDKSEIIEGNLLLSKDHMTCSQIKNDYLHVFSTYNKEEICKHYLNGDILSIDANIVVVRNDKKLEFYDRQSDWSLIIQENDFENCISAFLNPNKKEFITLDSNGKLSLWNVEKSNKVYDFEFNCRPKYMLPSPDFQFFSILSENRIIILNLETKEHSEYNVDERLSVIDYTKNSQYLLAKCEFAAIAINLNTTKQETFDSPGNFFKIQHIVSYHQSSRVLVYGTVEKDSRIYLWNLDNGDNELQSEASNMHFDQICISNYDMLLAKKSLKYLEVTTLCGDLILKKFVDYQRFNVYFSTDDERLAFWTGEKIKEIISFEKILTDNSQLVTIEAMDIVGNKNKISISRRMFVFHAKLKFAEIYETQLDKIELLLNSEILENHQKISKIANDDVLQAQILITKNT